MPGPWSSRIRSERPRRPSIEVARGGAPGSSGSSSSRPERAVRGILHARERAPRSPRAARPALTLCQPTERTHEREAVSTVQPTLRERWVARPNPRARQFVRRPCVFLHLGRRQARHPPPQLGRGDPPRPPPGWLPDPRRSSTPRARAPQGRTMTGRWGGSGQKGRRARGRGEDPGWIDALTREVVRVDRRPGAGGKGGEGGPFSLIPSPLARDRDSGGSSAARPAAARPAAETRAPGEAVRSHRKSEMPAPACSPWFDGPIEGRARPSTRPVGSAGDGAGASRTDRRSRKLEVDRRPGPDDGPRRDPALRHDPRGRAPGLPHGWGGLSLTVPARSLFSNPARRGVFPGHGDPGWARPVGGESET